MSKKNKGGQAARNRRAQRRAAEKAAFTNPSLADALSASNIGQQMAADAAAKAALAAKIAEIVARGAEAISQREIVIETEETRRREPMRTVIMTGRDTIVAAPVCKRTFVVRQDHEETPAEVVVADPAAEAEMIEAEALGLGFLLRAIRRLEQQIAACDRKASLASDRGDAITAAAKESEGLDLRDAVAEKRKTFVRALAHSRRQEAAKARRAEIEAAKAAAVDRKVAKAEAASANGNALARVKVETWRAGIAPRGSFITFPRGRDRDTWEAMAAAARAAGQPALAAAYSGMVVVR